MRCRITQRVYRDLATSKRRYGPLVHARVPPSPPPGRSLAAGGARLLTWSSFCLRFRLRFPDGRAWRRRRDDRAWQGGPSDWVVSAPEPSTRTLLVQERPSLVATRQSAPVPGAAMGRASFMEFTLGAWQEILDCVGNLDVPLLHVSAETCCWHALRYPRTPHTHATHTPPGAFQTQRGGLF